MYRVLPVLATAVALVLFVSGRGLAEDKKADDKGTTHEGKVVKVDGDKLIMVDKDGKNEHTHTLAADAKVMCNGKECKLTDLKPGTMVKVTTSKDDKTKATKIEARTKDKDK